MRTSKTTKYSNSYLNPHELEGRSEAQFYRSKIVARINCRTIAPLTHIRLASRYHSAPSVRLHRLALRLFSSMTF